MRSVPWSALFWIFLLVGREIHASELCLEGEARSQVLVRREAAEAWVEKLLDRVDSGEIFATPGADLSEIIYSKASEPLEKKNFQASFIAPKAVLGPTSKFELLTGKTFREKRLVNVGIPGFQLRELQLGPIDREWVGPFRLKIRVPIQKLSMVLDVNVRAAGIRAAKAYLEKHPEEAKDPEVLKALKFDPADEAFGPEHRIGISSLKVDIEGPKGAQYSQDMPYIEWEVEAGSGRTPAEGIVFDPNTVQISFPPKFFKLGLDGMSRAEEIEMQAAVETALQVLTPSPVLEESEPPPSGGWIKRTFVHCKQGIQEFQNGVGTMVAFGVETYSAQAAVQKLNQDLQEKGYVKNSLSFGYLFAALFGLEGGRKLVAGNTGLQNYISEAISSAIAPSLVEGVNDALSDNLKLREPFKVELPAGSLTEVAGMKREPKKVRPGVMAVVTAAGPDADKKFWLADITTCPSEVRGDFIGPLPKAVMKPAPDVKKAEGHDVVVVPSLSDVNRWIEKSFSDPEELKVIEELATSNPIAKTLHLDEPVRTLLKAPPRVVRIKNPVGEGHSLALEIWVKGKEHPQKMPLTPDMKLFDRATGGPIDTEEYRAAAVEGLKVVDGALEIQALKLEGVLLPSFTQNNAKIPLPKNKWLNLRKMVAGEEEDVLVLGFDLGEALKK